MANPIDGAIVAYQGAGAAAPGARERLDRAREWLSPAARLSELSLMHLETQGTFKPVTNAIQVMPALANLVSPHFSRHITEPFLKKAIPYIFAPKNVRMMATASFLFSLAMLKMGPKAFWENALPSLALIGVATMGIEHFILGPLNEYVSTQESILLYEKRRQLVAGFARLIENNPGCVRTCVALGLSLTVASQLLSKGYTEVPDAGILQTVLQTVQNGLPELFNTNFLHTSLFVIFSLGISPQALSNFLKDASSGLSVLTHGYRAAAFFEMLADDPLQSLERGHESARLPQIEALREELPQAFKDLKAQILQIKREKKTKESKLQACQLSLTKAQNLLDQTLLREDDSYRGYTERREDTPKVSRIDIRSEVSLATLAQRKVDDIAEKTAKRDELTSQLARFTAELGALNTQLQIRRAEKQTYLDEHVEVVRHLRAIKENEGSSNAFVLGVQRLRGAQLLARGGLSLLNRLSGGALEGASADPFGIQARLNRASLQTTSFLTHRTVATAAPFISRAVLTQVILPALLNSSLQSLGHDPKSRPIQIPIHLIGWSCFAALVYQFSQIYSTQAILEERRRPFEESQAVALFTRRLNQEQRLQFQEAISSILTAVEDPASPLIDRVRVGSRGLFTVAALSPRIPRQAVSLIDSINSAVEIIPFFLERLQSARRPEGAVDEGLIEDGAPDSDEEALAVARPNPAPAAPRIRLGHLFELEQALRGIYASTSPEAIVRDRPQMRL